MLFFALFFQELLGRLTRRILEHTGEVLGIFKTQFVGHLCNAPATENQILGAMNYKASDVVFRTLAQSTTHDVAEIAGRQAQLAGAYFTLGSPSCRCLPCS